MTTALKSKDKELLKRLAAKGRGQDNIIAHINPKEAAMLKRMGGKGTPHPETGLLEFDGGGEAFAPGDPQSFNPAFSTPFSAPQPTPAGPNEQAFLDSLMSAVGGDKAMYNQAVNKLYSGGGGSTYTGGESGMPTQDQIANVIGYDKSHYQPGFGSGPLASLGNFATSGPLGGIISAVGFPLAAAGGAEALGALAGVDATSLPLSSGVSSLFGGGVNDLTSQVGAIGADGTSTASIGDAGYTAGVAAADPSLFGAAGTDLAGEAAGYTAGLSGAADAAGGVGGGTAGIGAAAPADASAFGANALGDSLSGSSLADITSPFSSFAETAQSIDPTLGGAGAFGGEAPIGSVAPSALQPLGGVDAAGVGAAAAPATDSSSWFDSLFGAGAGSTLKDVAKVAGPLVSAGALASSLGSQKSGVGAIPQGNQLQGQANQLQNIGNQLTAPLLNNAPLPAGAQASIDQTKQAQKAHLRSTFAGLGMQGSTEETTALNQVDQQSAAQTFQIAQQLATQGISAIGGANAVYTQLMQAQLQQDQALQKAIANFSSALAGGTRLAVASGTGNAFG